MQGLHCPLSIMAARMPFLRLNHSLFHLVSFYVLSLLFELHFDSLGLGVAHVPAWSQCCFPGQDARTALQPVGLSSNKAAVSSKGVSKWASQLHENTKLA